MEKTFSQRYGFSPVRESMQYRSMDEPLRNALWDAVLHTTLSVVNSDNFYYRRGDLEPAVKLANLLWNQFFKEPTDTISRFWFEVVDALRKWFMQAEWHEVYSFVEFVAANAVHGDTLRKLANSYMEREVAAYRFVDKQIVEITDKAEIQTIESAIGNSKGPVATHLAAALSHLSDRDNPDYRNSVKESISGVEAAVRDIAGSPKATLGQALKTLPKPLPGAFEAAVSKLYGYTSDQSGIRHALSDESSVDAAEAKFMLVACSAFINLLRERAQKELP